MSRQALETAVISAMDAAGARVMEWGVDDCALWVADIQRGVLGYDPAAEVRGRYKTRRGAMRVTGRAGLKGALSRVARRHGWKRIRPDLAQPGDAGLIWTEAEGKPVLATVICRASGWFVGRNDAGFTAMRADRVAMAWSVLPDARDPGPGRRVNLGNWRPLVTPTSAVAHEPISTFIGLSALIATALGTTAAVGGLIGGAIISIAVAVGVSLVSSLLRPSTGGSVDAPIAVSGVGTDSVVGGTSDVSSIISAQVTERQSIPFKRVIVGSAYVGGALFFEQVTPPHLFQGILVNYGQITAVDRVFIGTSEIQFGTIVPDTLLTPIAIDGQPDYPDRLLASFRYGSDTQAVDPLILHGFPNVGSEFRQRGIATAVYRYDFGADQAAFTALWGQVARPTAYLVVRGVAVYDPRDATQNLSDETTWKWSDNASLIQAWYLTRDFGGRIPVANMLWDRVAISANYDDDLIGCNDGTMIKRHTIGGVITLNSQPFDVMQDLLTANRATILESGGNVWVESSMPKTPIATIHDRILAGGITYQAAKQKSDKVNKLQVRFISPDQDYQIVDGPVLNRTDLQTIDGEVLTATLALNYTQDERAAQRLQKCFLESSRLGRTITCTVDLSLMAVASDALIGNVITFDSTLFSAANGTYQITGMGFADDCTTLSLALAEYDATIETDWNSATDEQPFVLDDIDTSS